MSLQLDCMLHDVNIGFMMTHYSSADKGHGCSSAVSVVSQQYEFDACYILRHVEQQESEDIGIQPSGNWTIRKTAFYSKFIQGQSQQHSHSIIIEPSDALHSHLRQVLDPRATRATVEFPKHWTGFSHLCLGTLSVGWRWYTNLIAWEMKKIVRCHSIFNSSYLLLSLLTLVFSFERRLNFEN